MNNIIMYDNETLKWTHNGKQYCLHIQADNNPESPREWDGHLCTLACWHSRYRLGDDIGNLNPEEYFRNLVKENIPNYVVDDLTVFQAIQLLKPYAQIVPLWLYDHSGITISCGNGNPYCDSWDSGCVGQAVVLKDRLIREGCEYVLDKNGERIREEYKHDNAPSTWGYKTKPLTDETWRARATEIIKSEVEEYDTYLRGDVYGYSLYVKNDDEWEEVDSCWGFYGNDIMTNGIVDYADNGITEAIKSNRCEMGEATLHTNSYYTF